ncbi:MAG: anaerobic ribonucleoside-triphosphate reductase activating protein [Armatimonadia bacterium]
MKIGGYEPCSLCDYPGKVAAAVFMQGCNFRCPFCHNAQLLPLDAPADRLLSVEAVLERLRRAGRRLDAVVVSGGEPTLHDDLPEFLAELRGLGLEVKLDTNGSHPGMLARLLRDGLVDFVAMDLKAPWDKYDLLTGVAAPTEALRESVALLGRSTVAHQFRTTFVTDLLTEEDLRDIRRQLPPGSEYKVQPFLRSMALDPQLRRP